MKDANVLVYLQGLHELIAVSATIPDMGHIEPVIVVKLLFLRLLLHSILGFIFIMEEDEVFIALLSSLILLKEILLSEFWVGEIVYFN